MSPTCREVLYSHHCFAMFHVQTSQFALMAVVEFSSTAWKWTALISTWKMVRAEADSLKVGPQAKIYSLFCCMATLQCLRKVHCAQSWKKKDLERKISLKLWCHGYKIEDDFLNPVQATWWSHVLICQNHTNSCLHTAKQWISIYDKKGKLLTEFQCIQRGYWENGNKKCRLSILLRPWTIVNPRFLDCTFWAHLFFCLSSFLNFSRAPE